MPHVVTEKCLGEVYANCVEGCPVEAFQHGEYKGQPLMVIDPDLCIDCGVCLPICPIGAIVGSTDENPEWTRLNAELAPHFKGGPKAEPRDAKDPPRRPENKLVR